MIKDVNINNIIILVINPYFKFNKLLIISFKIN